MNESAEEAADRLYGLPLREFTSARNAAVKQLRARGMRAEADEMKILAKPTVAAWAVNQLTRRRHADLDEFLEAASAAREAQLGGDGDARKEIKRQREALAKLVRAAREELGGDASEAVTGRIRQTLEAAAVDDEAAEQVRRGRLAKELEPRGFGTLAAHAKAAPKRRAPREDAAASRKALQEERARLREAEDEHRAAVAEERQAHKRWQQAVGEAEQAAERVEQSREAFEKRRRA
jgi:hypothetical protein